MSEAPLKATLKAGTGYDAPWLTVDGDNPDDLKNKLVYLAEAGTLQAVADAAAQLHAVYSVGTVTAPPPPAPIQPEPQYQQQPSASWGQQQAPVQQAPQQQRGGRPGDRPHPEGKSCDQCGQVLVHKTTGSNKSVWRCPEWRWNNGNPNGHTQEWA